MTLAIYLTRIVGSRILICWIVLLLIALGIDLLRTSSKLIADGGPTMLAEYAGLRVPILGTILLPISVLAGALMAFLTLSSRSELTVVRAAGLNIWSLLTMLAPLAIALGVAYNMLGDRLTNVAQQRLAQLFPIEVVPQSADTRTGPIWSRGHLDILRATPAAPDGSALVDVTIYHLTAEGHVAARLTAVSAQFVEDGWMLQDVRRSQSAESEDFDSLRWDSLVTPADIFRLAKGQNTVSAGQAQAVLTGKAAPTRGRPFYENQIARGYSAFLVPCIMLLLAAPAAFASARHSGATRVAVLAIAMGFLYVAADGFTASLAKVGALDPWLGAFAPGGVFLIAGVWLVLLQES